LSNFQGHLPEKLTQSGSRIPIVLDLRHADLAWIAANNDTFCLVKEGYLMSSALSRVVCCSPVLSDVVSSCFDRSVATQLCSGAARK
jgi:hypothetical protein